MRVERYCVFDDDYGSKEELYTLLRICETLECNIGDIIDAVPDSAKK